MVIPVSPLLFSLLGLLCHSLLFQLLSAIFNSRHHFHCRAFSPLPSILSLFSQTAINAAFHSMMDCSLVGLPFLLWSCRRHIYTVAKDTFIVTKCRRPVFFFCGHRFHHFHTVIFSSSFLLSLVNNNSYTVILSKPASFSPALFCIPLKKRARIPTRYCFDMVE